MDPELKWTPRNPLRRSLIDPSQSSLPSDPSRHTHPPLPPLPLPPPPPPPPLPQPFGKYVVIAVFLAAVAGGALLWKKSEGSTTKVLACQQLLTDATQSLSDGDFEAALSKVRLGTVSCPEDQQGKANTLKREIEKDAAACNLKVAVIQSLMNGRQSARARSKLGEMSTVCAKSPGGQLVTALVNKGPSEAQTGAGAEGIPKATASGIAAPPIPSAPPTKQIKIEPKPQLPSASTATVEQSILSKAANDVQGSRLDSALARVNTILDMNPNNVEAKRIKADIQRLQEKAMREIKIE